MTLYRRERIGSSGLDVAPAPTNLISRGEVVLEIPLTGEAAEMTSGGVARAYVDRQELEQLREVIDEALS